MLSSKFPLNWSGDAFRGGVHTTGSKLGGRERMILTAGQLELRRAAATPTGARRRSSRSCAAR